MVCYSQYHFLLFIFSLIVNNSATITTNFSALLAPFLAFIYGPSQLICQLNQRLDCIAWSQEVVIVIYL
jgi:hypothetical protein